MTMTITIATTTTTTTTYHEFQVTGSRLYGTGPSTSEFGEQFGM